MEDKYIERFTNLWKVFEKAKENILELDKLKEEITLALNKAYEEGFEDGSNENI